MDAKLVWDTWRRILSDDKLVERVLHPDQVSSSQLIDLTTEEIAILADYASTPVATDTNIAMYRQGLVRNALAALSLVPLTQHLFYMSELDIDTAAAEFSQSIGYLDYGPNFWQIAEGFVAFLAKLPEFSGPEKQEVLDLDAATIALAQRLGKLAPEVWPETSTKTLSDVKLDAGGESTYLVANSAGTVVSSNHDLTEWLEHSDDFETNAALITSKCHWMIYFPSENASPEYAELSERSARAFQFLSAPKTVAQLSYLLGGISVGDVMEIVKSLAELGLIAMLQDTSLRSQDVFRRKRLEDETTDSVGQPMDGAPTA